MTPDGQKAASVSLYTHPQKYLSFWQSWCPLTPDSTYAMHCNYC